MKNFSKITVVSFCKLFFMCSIAGATPQVSAINYVDSGSSVVTGSGFGENSAVGSQDLVWMGDTFENGQIGEAFVATNWSQDSLVETSSQAVARYTDSSSHSGIQSLLIDYAFGIPTNRYRGWFRYQHQNIMEKVYVSFWVKAKSPDECTAAPDTAGCQWKIWRLNHTGANDNNYPDFYQNHWTNGQTSNQMYVNDGGLEALSSADHWNGQDEIPGVNGDNQWTRMEFWFEESAVNLSNGTIQYWFHNPSAEVLIKNPINLIGNIKTREVDYHFEYAVFGHVSGVPNLKTFWDDIFIQVGTQARVEIGDAPIWPDCTHREIQIPTSWNDTSITFNSKQGSFLPGAEVYVFVVDDNGVASAGKGPITIGGIGGQFSVPTPQGFPGEQFK